MAASLDSKPVFEIKKDEQKGRGLFAVQKIVQGDLVHSAPCLLVTKEEYETHHSHTILEHCMLKTPS